MLFVLRIFLLFSVIVVKVLRLLKMRLVMGVDGDDVIWKLVL